MHYDLAVGRILNVKQKLNIHTLQAKFIKKR